jgi:hypothetical protein
VTRGRPALFWLAFALMLGAGVAIVVAVRSFLGSLAPLWVSMGLSVAALVLGVLAVTLPGRAPAGEAAP